MARRAPFIKGFLDYLRIEKGLSRNTIQSYALDLARLQEWTRKNNKTLRLTERDISDYFSHGGSNTLPEAIGSNKWPGRQIIGSSYMAVRNSLI
jgi:site-specific recombinase XerD